MDDLVDYEVFSSFLSHQIEAMIKEIAATYGVPEMVAKGACSDQLHAHDQGQGYESILNDLEAMLGRKNSSSSDHS